MENFNQKEELIREIEVFDFLDNQSKVDIILTYKKLKPSCKIELFFKPGYESYSEEDFKVNTDRVERILKNFSLPYALEIEEVERDLCAAVFYVGKDKESLDKIKKAFSEKDEKIKDSTVGMEFGYPSTAIEGYGKRKIKKFESLPEEVRNSDYVKFLNFRLSENHWEDELKIVKQRADALKEISPDLYQKIIAVDKK